MIVSREIRSSTKPEHIFQLTLAQDEQPQLIDHQNFWNWSNISHTCLATISAGAVMARRLHQWCGSLADHLTFVEYIGRFEEGVGIGILVESSPWMERRVG